MLHGMSGNDKAVGRPAGYIRSQIRYAMRTLHGLRQPILRAKREQQKDSGIGEPQKTVLRGCLA